jgi:carboxylesterase type B
MFQDAEISNTSVSISAVRASAAGPGGWLYRFDMPIQRGVDKDLGATHAADVAFTFNNFAGDAPDSAFLYDKKTIPRSGCWLLMSDTIVLTYLTSMCFDAR